MPFTNEVIGTNGVLIRNWLQSANYVAGTSGWQITKAGNVEFNNGTFRGSLISGNPAAKHVVINNLANGDAIDVYNASNQLVFNVDNNGQVASYDTSALNIARIFAGTLALTGQNVSIPAIVETVSVKANPAASNTTQGFLDIAINGTGSGGGGVVGNDIRMASGSGNGAFGPTILANERNIFGSLVQSDQQSTNNLFHYGEYTVTTDASGTFVFNHGLSYTPTGSLWHIASVGSPVVGYMFAYSSTTATGRAFNGGSGANIANATFAIHALMLG